MRRKNASLWQFASAANQLRPPALAAAAIGEWQPSTMDIYANSGTGPPPSGSPRTAAVTILLAAAFSEGSRARIASAFGFTHLILCDPQIEVHDGYLGNSSTYGTQPDILKIPAGTANYWVAVMVQMATVPGLGQRKLIYADRRTTVGDWTKIL